MEDPLIDSKFVLIALCFNILGTSIYVRSTLRGEIRPHLVTWFLWAFASYVAFAAQVREGVGMTSLVTLIVGINPTIVFLISVRRKEAHWAVSSFDLICGFLSVSGLVLWIIFQEAGFAIGLAVLSDALASVPTFRKSFIDPASETWIVYACLTVSALITMATIDHWSFAESAFVVYLASCGVGMTLLILIRSRRRGDPPR